MKINIIPIIKVALIQTAIFIVGAAIGLLIIFTALFWVQQYEINEILGSRIITVNNQPLGLSGYSDIDILRCMTCHPKFDFEKKKGCYREEIEKGKRK